MLSQQFVLRRSKNFIKEMQKYIFMFRLHQNRNNCIVFQALWTQILVLWSQISVYLQLAALRQVTQFATIKQTIYVHKAHNTIQLSPNLKGMQKLTSHFINLIEIRLLCDVFFFPSAEPFTFNNILYQLSTSSMMLNI